MTPATRPIIAPPATVVKPRRESERKLERLEAYTIIGNMIVDRFFSAKVPFAALMEEEEIPGAHGSMRAVHELRYETLTISENGVVGKVSPAHFMHHLVGLPIHGLRHWLKQEQPSCDWWIVAFQIEARDLTRTFDAWSDHVVDARALERAARGERAFGEASPNVRAQDFADQDENDPQPVATGPRARVVEDPDVQIVVHIAFADVRRSKLVDPVTHLQQRYNPDNKSESFMRDYAKTQNLDFLSEGARMNRELAKAVIRAFDTEQRKLRGEAERLGTTDDPPAPKASAQVVPPPPPAKARAKQGEVDDAKRARIRELRAAGRLPADIAKAVRVKTERVIEVLAEVE